MNNFIESNDNTDSNDRNVGDMMSMMMSMSIY